MENKINKINRNQYIDCDKIEQLRKDRNYSISYMNKNVLQLNGRNSLRRKLNGEIAFSVSELVLLANLFNVGVEDLLIKKGKL